MGGLAKDQKRICDVSAEHPFPVERGYRFRQPVDPLQPRKRMPDKPAKDVFRRIRPVLENDDDRILRDMKVLLQ